MAFMAALLPSILGSIAAGLVVSQLTKKDSPQAQAVPSAAAMEAPVVEKPTAMPTPNDAQQKAAQRRSMAEQMARRGRASTILTNDADAKLGG